VGGQHGAAEVHQHQDAGAAFRGLDRGHDRRRVRAERSVGGPAGRLDAQVVARHLAGELDGARGDLGGVADDDDPDERLHDGQPMRRRAASWGAMRRRG
jgi:hypothetical protein